MENFVGKHSDVEEFISWVSSSGRSATSWKRKVRLGLAVRLGECLVKTGRSATSWKRKDRLGLAVCLGDVMIC